MLDQEVFEATVNLHSALQHLRRETEELTLWVDAICINQSDNDEKSWQVQQMNDVYEKARLVTVWLGPASEDSDLAMHKLMVFGDKLKHHSILKWGYSYQLELWASIRIPEWKLEEGESTLEEFLSSISVGYDDNADLPVSAVLAFFSRACRQRVWVFQDLALAKDVIFHCGKKTIAADSLSAALTAFRVYQQAITGTLYRGPLSYVPMEFDARPYMMLSARRTTDLEFIKLPLYRLLQAACSYTRRIHRPEATDPRDTVYALLGLSSDAEERGIYPDYTKPCWQVFAKVSRIYMKLEDGPGFLSLCYFPKQQPDLPS
jgi:hypothetical protein